MLEAIHVPIKNSREPFSLLRGPFSFFRGNHGAKYSQKRTAITVPFGKESIERGRTLDETLIDLRLGWGKKKKGELKSLG